MHPSLPLLAKVPVIVYIAAAEPPGLLDASPQLLMSLPTKEQAHWRSIASPTRRGQFLQSRLMLRNLLSWHVGASAESLRFVKSPLGRPSLAHHGGVHFSLSHCGSHIALAVSNDAVLGIDAEPRHPERRSFLHIAAGEFNSVEFACIERGDRHTAYARFLEYWTLKEAHLKALGLGLSKSFADCVFTERAPGIWHGLDYSLTTSQAQSIQYRTVLWDAACQIALAYCGDREPYFLRTVPRDFLPSSL